MRFTAETSAWMEMIHQIQKRWRVISLIALIVVLFLLFSGRFLVADGPKKSDVIVVLAGEIDARPACGLRLLRQGYAPLMLLDVPADAKVYQWSETNLAAKYINGLTEAKSIRICPIHGLSTKAEMSDVEHCLNALQAHKVLLETSSYHTRRALSIFSVSDKTHEYSVAACEEPKSFGVYWWHQREWAKTNFYEWIRLLWWELVDRWHRN